MNTVNILLVDDDEDDFIITKDILRENGSRQNYNLTWCNNFSEAINAMLKSHYDIYLVDYRLGRDSGMDLLNEAIKSNCTEPIIMLTGKGDFMIDEEAMRLGAADYLVKDTLNGQVLERSIRYAIAQNRALQRLKTSENKFRIIFERSKNPMLITDAAGKIIEANPSATKFFETTLPELLKLNASTLYKHKEEQLVYVTTMNAEGSVSDLEVEMLTINGKNKFCSISSFVQLSQQGDEELFYSIIHDLTYRLNHERDSSLRDTFAVTELMAKRFSNEIRNPLSNVNLAIDELSSALSNEDDLNLVDIIKSNCAKINSVTTELIKSTEPLSLKFTKLDLSELLSRLLEEAERGLDLRIENPLKGATLLIMADAEGLISALKNILKNSAEAITEEEKKVSISIEKRFEGITIHIKDNGAGILPENVNQVFEPFFTTKAKAAGLGLTHAKRILNAHHGKIQVSSHPGSGTIISIILPTFD
jgi:PAS domain S-box-containing protein